MKRIVFLLPALLLFMSTMVYAGSVKVVANKGLGLESVSRSELQQIFLGKVVTWSNGKKAVPVTLKGGAVHDEFLKTHMGKSPSQYDTFWKQAIFTGTGRPPKALGSDADVVKFVSSTEGAVGYISAESPYSGVVVIDVK